MQSEEDNLNFSAAAAILTTTESIENPVIIKEGILKRWVTGLFTKDHWKECYVEFYSDSDLVWYNKKEDPKPIDSITLKKYVEYICVGSMTEAMLGLKPEPPLDFDIHHRVAFGKDPFGNDVEWFIFNSIQDIEEWFSAIATTFPKSDLLTKHEDILTSWSTTPKLDPIPPIIFATEKLEKIIIDNNFGCFFTEVEKRRKHFVAGQNEIDDL